MSVLADIALQIPCSIPVLCLPAVSTDKLVLGSSGYVRRQVFPAVQTGMPHECTEALVIVPRRGP